MRADKYKINEDVSITVLNMETYLESSKEKSYKEIWLRSLRKIKIMLIFKRFQNSTKKSSANFNYKSKSLAPSKPTTAKLLFLPHSPLYLFWIVLVSVCLFYLTTYGIFYTSFVGDNPESTELLVESMIDIIFLIDIFFTANLAILNKHCQLVFDRKKILFKYLKFDFYLDSFAALPTGVIIKAYRLTGYTNFLLFRHIAKIIKWMTQVKKIRHFSLTKFDYVMIKFKNFVDSVELILSFYILSHIFACLFFLTARVNCFDSGTWVFNAGILGDNIFEQYTTSLYLSVFTVAGVGYGDIHLYSDSEKLLAMFWMTFATVFTSLSASRFTVIINSLLKKDLLIESHVQVANDYCKLTRIPISLRNTIKNFIKDQRITTYKFKLSAILKSINQDLKYEIATNIYEKGITKVPFFDKKSEKFISDMAFFLHFLKYEKDEIIWQKNSTSDGIYFILLGRVKYLHDNILFFTYSEGGFFGDLEIFLKSQRKFKVLTCTLCKLFRLGSDKVLYIKENYPNYYRELKDMQEIRRKNLLRGLSEMLAICKNNGTYEQIFEIHDELVDDMFDRELKPLEISLNVAWSDLEEIKKTRRNVRKMIEYLEEFE